MNLDHVDFGGLRSATLMQPDVILLDLNLPDRRGEEVLEQLLSERSTQAIPVVVATSEQLTHARRESLAAKAARVLCKQDIVPHALHKLLMQTALGTRA